jgi:hypothetical protein
VGSPFLQFQWDALLLETGFLAVCWSPATAALGSPRARTPSPIILFFLRFLVFRLMFFSGWVKLASGDPVWWDLTALEYHYWTQPLPSWTSWYANLLPQALHRLSGAIMFAIELGLPFLVFAPRRLRILAAGGFLLFQLAIAATGNYGFFNRRSSVYRSSTTGCSLGDGVPRSSNRAVPLSSSAWPTSPSPRCSSRSRCRSAGASSPARPHPSTGCSRPTPSGCAPSTSSIPTASSR